LRGSAVEAETFALPQPTLSLSHSSFCPPYCCARAGTIRGTRRKTPLYVGTTLSLCPSAALSLLDVYANIVHTPLSRSTPPARRCHAIGLVCRRHATLDRPADSHAMPRYPQSIIAVAVTPTLSPMLPMPPLPLPLISPIRHLGATLFNTASIAAPPACSTTPSVSYRCCAGTSSYLPASCPYH